MSRARSSSAPQCPSESSDAFDGPLDPVDCVLDEFEREAGATARREIGNGVERRVHIGRPTSRLAIVDETPRVHRAVDYLAQPCLERPIVGVDRRRSQIQAAKQSGVALGHVHDHLDKGVDALSLQMAAYAREHTGAVRIRIIAGGVRRQRRRDHVLAKAPIVERRAGALAPDLLAAPGDDGPVILRAGNLRQHALRLDAENGDLPGPIILLAAREHVAPGQLAQRADIEAGSAARRSHSDFLLRSEGLDPHLPALPPCHRPLIAIDASGRPGPAANLTYGPADSPPLRGVPLHARSAFDDAWDQASHPPEPRCYSAHPLRHLSNTNADWAERTRARKS